MITKEKLAKTTLLLALIIVASRTARAAIAYVQSNETGYGGSPTPSVAFIGENAAGNLLTLSVITADTTTNVSSLPTDTRGNTWGLAIGPVRGSSGSAWIYYSMGCLAGTNTVTVNLSASAVVSVAVHEYSGLATAGALDQTASGTGNSTSPSTASVSTTYSNELIFAVSAIFPGGQSFTNGAGFNTRINVTGGSLDRATEDRVVTSAGSYNASGTWSGTGNPWVMAMATFAQPSSTAKLKVTGAARVSGAGRIQ